MIIHLRALGLLLSVRLSTALVLDQLYLPGPSYEELPSKPVFPGPWDENIQAPANKTHIRPKRIWNQEGNVGEADVVVDGVSKNRSLTMSPGGLVTLEFAQNIAGR
jgi:hypothetical protein